MSFPLPMPSTFMPLPLAIMIPFMGIQSGVMAQQFGQNFQYGKRRISAMSNEEFNKLTPQMMQEEMATQIRQLIPTFRESLIDMRPFQRDIFVEMLAAMKEAVQVGLDVAAAGADPMAHIFGQHTHGSTQTPTNPPLDPHKFLSPAQIQQHKEHGHMGGIIAPTPPPSPPTPPPTTQKRVSFTTVAFRSGYPITYHKNVVVTISALQNLIKFHNQFLKKVGGTRSTAGRRIISAVRSMMGAITALS